MLSRYKQKLYNPVCLSCGSFFVLDHLFCETCFEFKILPLFSLDETRIQSSSCYHFLNWIPDQSDVISEMVYRLKREKAALAWKFYASLANELLPQKISELFDFIIPIPGSSASSRHAYFFAEFLAKHLNKPVLPLLEKSNSGIDIIAQKNLSRESRALTCLKVSEQFTSLVGDVSFRSKRLLLIDDIQTTGNTYRQALLALGPVRKATLVTLFYRRLSPNTTLVS